MDKKNMTQFFISCKESRVENNRSFYGCFYLGPFDPGQSITVANALRRTLLSELTGLAIVSVEIEGAIHEYSTIPGVRDSVLDILLNLKEIVFKKICQNFKPQIGYLRARGPGVVRAGDLQLPPLIKCVDPDQYIATLADDGFLKMKFIIHEGKNYTVQKSKRDNINDPNFLLGTRDFVGAPRFSILKKNRLILKKLQRFAQPSQKKIFGAYQNGINSEINIESSNENSWPQLIPGASVQNKELATKNLIFNKKGRALKNHYCAQLFMAVPFFLRSKKKDKVYNYFTGKQDQNIGYFPNNYSFFLKKKRGNYLVGALARFFDRQTTKKTKLRLVKTTLFDKLCCPMELKKKDRLFSNPLHIDAVFSPINKVNYIIEVSEHKMVESAFKYSTGIDDFFSLINSLNLSMRKKNLYLKQSLIYKLLELFNNWQNQLLNQFSNNQSSKLVGSSAPSNKFEGAEKHKNYKHALKSLKIWQKDKDKKVNQNFYFFDEARTNNNYKHAKEDQNNYLNQNLLAPYLQKKRGQKAMPFIFPDKAKKKKYDIARKRASSFLGFNRILTNNNDFTQAKKHLRLLIKNLLDKQISISYPRLQFFLRSKKKSFLKIKKSFSYLHPLDNKKEKREAFNLLLGKNRKLKNEVPKKGQKSVFGTLKNSWAGQKKYRGPNNYFWFGARAQDNAKKDKYPNLVEGGDKIYPKIILERQQQNIILEIWTNGSIHPRIALYNAFKILLGLFSKLKKIHSSAYMPVQVPINQIYKSSRSYQKLSNQIKNENLELFTRRL